MSHARRTPEHPLDPSAHACRRMMRDLAAALAAAGEQIVVHLLVDADREIWKGIPGLKVQDLHHGWFNDRMEVAEGDGLLKRSTTVAGLVPPATGTRATEVRLGHYTAAQNRVDRLTITKARTASDMATAVLAILKRDRARRQAETEATAARDALAANLAQMLETLGIGSARTASGMLAWRSGPDRNYTATNNRGMVEIRLSGEVPMTVIHGVGVGGTPKVIRAVHMALCAYEELADRLRTELGTTPS